MNSLRLAFLARRQLGGIAASALLLALWRPAPAAAHALIVSSTPSADAAVAGPEIDIRIRLSDRIDKKRSKLSVVSKAGQTYPVQPLDDERPDTLAGYVADLSAGSYRLQWQVLAVDGHITRGVIPFSVTTP